MNKGETIQQFTDEVNSLQLKRLEAVAEGAGFSKPELVAQNAMTLHESSSEVSPQSLQLQPTLHHQGLRKALWALNTYKLSIHNDGSFVEPEQATLRDWEVPSRDRRLARVSLGEWRYGKKNNVLPYDEDDTVRMYLQHIGRVKLLTAEEEVELAKTIEAGLYAGHRLEGGKANKGDDLSAEDRRNFAELALAGKDAFDHYYEANLRLVVSIARKYTGHGLPLMDIIQEGNLGLCHAIEKFDYTLGIKFSVYATRWIKQFIQTAIPMQSRTIAITKHDNTNLRRVLSRKADFERESNENPSIEELARASGLDAKHVSDLLNNHSRHPLSLEQTVNEDSNAPMSDLLSDKDELLIEDMVVVQDSKEALRLSLRDEMKKLEGFKRKGEKKTVHEVVTVLYGIDDGKQKVITEAAEILGIGRGAVGLARDIAVDMMSQNDTLRDLYEQQ